MQAERGLTVLMVLHDLNLAARFADRVVLVVDGHVVANGPPAEVLTPEWLRVAYGVEADVLVHPRTGAPICVPYATA